MLATAATAACGNFNLESPSSLVNPSWRANNVTTIHLQKKAEANKAAISAKKQQKAVPWKEDSYGHVEAITKIQAMYFATVLIAFSAFMYVYHCVDLHLPSMPTVESRLVYTLQCQLLSLASVVYTIQGVLNTRARTCGGWNTNTKSTVSAMEVPQRILQNAVEQYLLHAASLAILSTYLEEAQMAIIPTIVAMWSVGRVLFCIGYNTHNMYRVPGFGLSFFPSMITIAYLTYRSYGVLPGIVWWPLAGLMGYAATMITKFFLIPFGFEY